MNILSLLKPVRSIAITTSLLSISAFSNAANYSFGCISDSPENCATAQTHLVVDVTTGASADEVAFTFTNSDPLSSSITAVYFDDDSNSLMTMAGITTSSGASFSQGAKPKSLPGGKNVDWDSPQDFSAGSNPSRYHNGVNSSQEWLTVNFILNDGYSIADVYDALALGLADPGGLRIGMHVQGFSNGGSISVVNNASPVPVPAAAWLFGGALLSLISIKRQR
jgi:hypothetical protein